MALLMLFNVWPEEGGQLQYLQEQMFPNNYTFNPGVVLDPITMTPMIGGNSFTVNPFGIPAKPEQKIWQKMFIKDIPSECSNECMVKLLAEFGEVKNFKRSNNSRGQLLSFCYFDFESGEEILRLKRLFKNIKVLDKTLELKVSAETDGFIKEWITIQKDEWRKKLLAPGMNEAKEYDTIDDFHQREDGKYKQKIEQILRTINVQVKRTAMEKMREEQKKQHPREKEREKKKKRIAEELDRNFKQQEEYLLKRQRNKEKQHRKQKDKDREREKAKVKRLEKEIDLAVDEEEKRMAKYLSPDRIKLVEKQQLEDLQILEEENPPLPEEQAPVVHQKKTKFIAGQQIEVKHNDETNEQILVKMPEQYKEGHEKEVRVSKIFEDWDKNEEIEEERPAYELKLPELNEGEKEEERERRKKIMELQKLIPMNKFDLWEYPIDWDKLSKSVVLERNIRPWLQERSSEYMGSVEQKFIAMVEKKLFSRSHPQKIIKIMTQLIDTDAQEFVIKLWKALVLEDLKLKQDLI